MFSEEHFFDKINEEYKKIRMKVEWVQVSLITKELQVCLKKPTYYPGFGVCGALFNLGYTPLRVESNGPEFILVDCSMVECRQDDFLN